jgi:ABC-type arginine transport system permease subunit
VSIFPWLQDVIMVVAREGSLVAVIGRTDILREAENANRAGKAFRLVGL